MNQNNTKKIKWNIYFNNTQVGIVLLILAAIGLRILFACTYRGFETDTNCFFSWANMLWENGISNFYSPDYFCDYPPGYLYILWLLGGLLDAFGLHSITGASLLIIKTPAILCDLAAGYLIYRYAGKYFSNTKAIFLSACYLFHPAVLINSSFWGQTDAVFTLLVIIVCILLSEKRTIPAYFIYAAGILIKPQTLVFAPLILCALAEYMLRTGSVKKILTNLAGGLAAILMMVLLAFPFGMQNVFTQYTDTLSSYPYAAVNACNLWGLFGQNWISQDTKLGVLTYAQMGTISIVLITLGAFVFFFFFKKTHRPLLFDRGIPYRFHVPLLCKNA